mgnify:CR=1 FL=1
MLQFLQRLIGWSGKPAQEVSRTREEKPEFSSDFARLNDEVPLQSADGQHKAFVRREAIIDRSEKIAGYEFSLLMTLQARLLVRSGAARRAYDAALLTRLAWRGVASLLGHRLAFINISSASVNNALIDQIPPEKTVLMLELAPETANAEDLGARLGELKERGFVLGLRIQDAIDTNCPLIAMVDFIQIDVSRFNGLDLRVLTRKLGARQPAPGKPLPRLVARDVRSYDEFQFCEKCDFDFFQGPFISGRESLRPVREKVNRLAVFPILSMVRSDQSFALIAEQLKSEPTLTFRLLRYLNSAAMGLTKPIESLTQALVLIGREKFYRWTSMLLFDFAEPSYRERLLAERALTRGRTLELLAGKGYIPNAGDHLFLIGLFSLIDLALAQPLPELLEKAMLPDAVREALLGHSGAYADALALVNLGDPDATTLPEQMADALERCGITDMLFTPVAAEALVWANQTIGDAG